MPLRKNLGGARDTSLVPNMESDATKLTFSSDAEQTLDLTAFGFVPLILLVRGDGDFHEGADAPDQANDLWRDADQVWSIAVNGRDTWHFKRKTGASTVNLYIKALGSV